MLSRTCPVPERPPAHPHAAAARARGFTLLEIVIAVAVVGLGMAAAFTTINRVAFNASFLRDKTLGNWVALNKIAELRLEAAAPEAGESSGEEEFAGQTFRWESEVIETGVEDLRRVDIIIRYADEDRQVAKVSGFLGPAAQGTGTPTPWTGAAAAGPGGPGGPGGGREEE